MKLKRSVMALLATGLCGLACGLIPAVASARYHLTVGITDNGSSMFTSHWWKIANFKVARLAVPWNVASDRRYRSTLSDARAWIKAAQAAHVQTMVTFGADPGNAGNYVPSDKVYTAAIKAFLHDFPQVKQYIPWNEPEFIYRSLSRQPGLAAAYFNTMVRWCHHCKIVAGGFYRPANDGLASWIRAYKHGLRFKPVAWAIHPYDDIRSHTTAAIGTLERFVGGSQIWLDEISGVERRGHWPFPNQSPNGANNDERFLFALPKRFHNITRIYHFEWQGPAASLHVGWDSGLLGPGGKPRPAYWTARNASRGKLP